MDARSEMRTSQTNIFYQTNMQLFLTREPKRISVENKTMRAPAEIPTAKPMWRSSTKKKTMKKPKEKK